MSRKQIEVFTAGCPVCQPVVDMVNEMAEPGQVTIRLLGRDDRDAELVARYGIRTVPAVAVDGELLACCRNTGPTREELLNSGIG
ncbi:MAG: thioredoxin family protein [Actinomycetota bacterium]|nr:thioredoxin family protein [Actinomycetota bacterium]